MRRLLSALVVGSVFVVCIPNVSAQIHIGPVGYIDSTVIFRSFYSESGRAQEYVAHYHEFVSQIREIEDEITWLRSRRAAAHEREDTATVQSLSARIDDLAQHLGDVRARWAITEQAYRDELAGEEFYARYYESIRYVAESLGFLSVIDVVDNPTVVYFNPEVDLTDEVLAEMLSR